jgi:sigma-B regulation protein RsbQ
MPLSSLAPARATTIPSAARDVLARHRVTVTGRPDGPPLLFAHGFGCDQAMWRHVAPAFTAEHRVVTFDHAGAGGADPTLFRPERYPTLRAYADDVLAICAALDLRDVTLVGHSVSAMIAVLAAIAEPERFASLVLVCPSPRYVDDAGYVGGFTPADIHSLLEMIDRDHLGWSSTLAPMVAGGADRAGVTDELEASFCRTDPEAARHFARLTFLADNRADLARVPVPALVVQSREDAIAQPAVGAFVEQQLPLGELVVLDAVGHCPHLSDPDQTIEVLRAHLER